MAAAQLAGAISNEVLAIRGELLAMLAGIEASIDFPDDVGGPAKQQLGRDISLLGQRIQQMLATADEGWVPFVLGLLSYVVKLAVGGFILAVFETATAKMRVFRVSDFLGAALMLGLLAALLLFVSRGV